MFTITINDKKRGNSKIEVDFDALPENVRQEVVRQGLAKMLNCKSSKLSNREAAERKHEAMKAGKVRATAASQDGFTGKEKTEAMRLARQAVKAGMKEQGYNVSDYAASVITEMAKEYLGDYPEVFEQARRNVEAAAALAPKAKITAEPDPAKVAKREAAKKEKKTEAKPPKGKRTVKAKPAVHVQA